MVLKENLRHASLLDCCKNVHKQQRTTNDDREIQLKALYIIQLLIPQSSIFLSIPAHQDRRMSIVIHICTASILEAHQTDHVTNYINVNSKKILSCNKHGNPDQFFYFFFLPKSYLKHVLQRLMLPGITVVSQWWIGMGIQGCRDFDLGRG